MNDVFDNESKKEKLMFTAMTKSSRSFIFYCFMVLDSFKTIQSYFIAFF